MVSKEKLEKLSLEKLMGLLNPNFYLANTWFTEPSKKVVILHIYNFLADVNVSNNNWDNFGLDPKLVYEALIPAVYGTDYKSCLISFLTQHEDLIQLPEQTLKKYLEENVC